jgi:SAM-dependent methyltransferase
MKPVEEIKEFSKDIYGKVASEGEGCSCCINYAKDVDLVNQAVFLGYCEAEIREIPKEALMGLGSGNPLAFVSLAEGQTVLDLGSGAGVDSFLAAQKVGNSGQVIGVDLTEGMVQKARRLAHKYGYTNTSFKVGDVEDLPVSDESVDVVISNCVLNLTPNKLAVFKEAYRVLKPGGIMVISDMVADGEISEYVKWCFEAWTGCKTGLIQKQEYINLIKEAGFINVELRKERPFQKFGLGGNSGEEIKSIQVRAQKAYHYHLGGE